MSFRTVAIVTSVFALILGAGYLLAGALLIGRWQIEPTEALLLFGRRLGALYLGLAVIFFLARSAPRSVARTALCAGTAVACSLLALLGVFELSAGRVGPAILASIVVEALLALGYIRVLLTDREAAPAG